MRRADKEVKDQASIESIIANATVCRVAMCKNNEPYLVPFSFGYEESTVYVHCAREGRKLEMLTANNRVCVEFEADVQLVEGEAACNWSMAYRSVMGFGQAFIVDDIGSKRKACDLIMRHYADKHFEYTDAALDAIIVIRIELDSMTGKQSGY